MAPKKDNNNKEGEERESRDTTRHISFADIEKSMTSFSGDDTYPISTWLNEFEDTALLMNWSEIEKLIYAKRLLSGTAKLFLRSLGSVKDYEKLKDQLEEEFGSKLNSAAIHKKLSARKMQKDETYQQYFLHMKECALHGNVEDAALMEYVIDGIQDSENNKSVLYGASNLKEFRMKLDIYKNIKEKTQTRPNLATTSSGKTFKVKRCFNCGDLDHETPTCKMGIKCFKCNEFGHKGFECTNGGKKMLNILKEDVKMKIDEEDREPKSPYKKIKINDVEMTALIDTGSDANLIKLSEVTKVMKEVNYDKGKSINLTGIAGNELSTEGLLKAKIMVDDNYADVEFHVIQDYAIPVNVILGNPILKDFEINFTADGIFLKKITYLKLLTEEKSSAIGDENYPKNKEIAQKITKMIVEEYKPEIKKKESHNEKKIILTEAATRLKKVQDDDSRIHLLKKILEKEPYEDYVMESGILCKDKDGTRLIVVPKKMPNKIIRKKHDYGHSGVKKTKEEAKDYNERRNALRVRAKDPQIQKIQEENIKNYKRKRKRVTEFNVEDSVAIKRTQFTQESKLCPKFPRSYKVTAKRHHERYAVQKVCKGEGPIKTTTSADLMKPWADDAGDGCSSGSDE